MSTPKNVARGKITQIVKDIMNANATLPMHDVCGLIQKKCGRADGVLPGMTMSYARAWYRDFVNRNLAKGKIEKAPSRAKPKEAKTPSTHPATAAGAKTGKGKGHTTAKPKVDANVVAQLAGKAAANATTAAVKAAIEDAPAATI